MNQYDISKVYSTLRWLANSIVGDYQNKSLTPEMQDKMDKFYLSLNNIINWEALTLEDCRNLGFMTYADYEDEYEVWLIPAWLYPVIPEGLTLWDSNLNQFTFRKDECSFEVYYGALNFGLRFKNPIYKKSLEQLIEDLPDDN